MIDRHIKKTKIHFSVGMIFLLATLISGVATLKNVPYFSYDFLTKNLNYLKYKQKVDSVKVYSRFSQGYAESIPVLVYHGLVENVGDKDDSQTGEGINISPEKFFDQMLALKKDGWSTVSIYDFHDFLQGKKTLPEKSFLLTFDDGRKDSYYQADPILKALGFRATIFVITERSLDAKKRSSFYLSKPELKEMIKSKRWDIQSHGKKDHDLYDIGNGLKGHFLSNRLWNSNEGRLENMEEARERIRKDLVDSKEELERELGVRVIGFAYPFGDYGDQSLNALGIESSVLEFTSDIYSLAFYQESSVGGFLFNYPFINNSRESSPLMKRIKFYESLNGSNLVQRLNISMNKSLPFKDEFRLNKGWYGMWGTYSILNGNLHVGASQTTSGGAVFLDGSQAWRDYSFSVIPNDVSGESVTMLARYKDEGNFFECTYTNGYIRIKQTFDYETRVLKELKISTLLSDTRSFGIRVRGNEVSCQLNGTTLLTDFFSDLDQGAIGIKTWDKEIGKSSLNISRIEVHDEN